MNQNLLQKRAFRAALLTLLLCVAGVTNLKAQVPQGAINGVFTINENGDRVYFSQGNLQYQASTEIWRFAENQWDYVGADNANISETYDGWIDLFGWGTSGYNHGANCYQPWSTSQSNSDYYAYGYPAYSLNDLTGLADWGYNAISNGGNQENSGWRTLSWSYGEVRYVFENRNTSSGIRYAKAQVNGRNGVILFPDSWNVSFYQPNNANILAAAFSSNVITESQWVRLEEQGLVFLPAAGARYGTSVYSVGSYGYYWSESGYGQEASSTYFYDGYFYIGPTASLSNGFSVRLVCPAENYSFGIKATPTPPLGGVVSGAGAYAEGTECTLTATANAGYEFLDWVENGEVVSSDATLTFTVDSDRWLVARFKKSNSIVFADMNTERLCLDHWDSDGDELLSYEEAAAVTDLSTVFKGNSAIISFDELRYFTGLTTIPAQAFFNCNQLRSVAFPESLTSIGSMAFQNCTNLKNDLVLPNNLTTIGSNAFMNCTSLTSVTIGSSISQIDSYAFVGCSNIQTIRSLAVTPPAVTNIVFDNTDAALYVPCESQATYQADPVWGTFTNYQNKAFELVVESEDASQGEASILKYGDCDDPLCTVSANPMPHYGFSCWLKNGEVVSANRVYNFNIEENTTLIARFEPSENIAMHWVPNNEFYEDYMMLTGVVNIDSVEQTSTTLELGAFCNDECRGSVLANYCPPLDRYVYQLPVYGNNGDVITFKLFDHNSQQELTMERLPGVMIGDENSSTTLNYFPFYTFYRYSIAEQLYLANELIEAGMNTTPMASLSFEATFETGYEQKNISIWMANVSDAQLTSTSHNTAGMTLVYTGNITPVIGWNEIVFNQNQFAWDGSSNLLICVERNHGDYNTAIRWKSHNAGFNAMAYRYNDNAPYNMAGETYTAYTSASRVNTRFRNTSSLACQTELVLNINNVIPADDPMVIYFVSRIPVLTTPSPAEGGEVTGTGEYLPGETVTVTATPYENYVFTGWMENGTLVSTDLEYTFTVESVRNLIARFERVQTISLNSGWNWFSTYIEQNNINGLALLENSLEDHGLQIKSMNDGFVQYDNETNSWSGSLSSITNEQLYMIQTNAETSITLHGDKAKPSQHSISINQGWNWIGYWCDTEMGLEEAMASISPTQNDAVKSRTAFSSYFTDYGWYGNLQTLVPGQGYQYVSQNANTKTLRYPTPSRARNLAKTEAVTTHFDVKGQSYRDNMNFMAVVTLDDLELNGDRYELAAFVDDVCHGTTKLLYVEPLDRYVAFLTVLGQDGEEVSFRLYDDQTGTTYEAEAHEAFHTNVILGSQQSLYPIHFKSKALADNRPAIYPNPANKGASLSIVNASDDMVMEITNMLGVTVKTMRLLGENTTVDCDLAPGAYTVRLVKNHETVMIEKLIVK
jgi:hypothetical protein